MFNKDKILDHQLIIGLSIDYTSEDFLVQIKFSSII